MVKEVKIEVTEQCQRMCVHCSSDAKIQGQQFLDSQTVLRILQEAKGLGVQTIVFTGGEVMLYPFLEEVIDASSELGFQNKIYTMADPIEKTISSIQKLCDLGLQELIYSTSFRLTRDGMVNGQKLQEFFPKLLDSTNIHLGFHHVITKDTLPDLDEISKLFFSLPDEQTTSLSLLRYVPHGRGDHTLLLSKEETLLFRKKVLQLREQYGHKIRLGSPWNYLYIQYTPCTAAKDAMIVGFDGSVYPCDAMKYFDFLGSGGNIYENTLEEIYASSYFEMIRKYEEEVSDTCLECSWFHGCKGGCLGQKMVAYLDSEHLTFEDYGNQALRTMKDFGTQDIQRLNGELGLIGELGEFFDSFKKYKTHDISEENKEKIRKNLAIEAGDVMWYIAASLGASYGVSFQEIGMYLLENESSRVRQKILVDEPALEKCASKEDPECLFLKHSKNLYLSSLDVFEKEYDFNIEWKELVFVACNLLRVANKEEILQQSSKFLNILTTIVNHELGISIEEVARLNIEKLKSRYKQGFDVQISNSRIDLLTEYKTREIAPEKVMSKKKI